MINYASLGANLLLSRRYPISLVHFVTNRCNARCSFCFIDFDDDRIYHNQLTLDEIDAMTRQLGPHLKNVNLTGGEPFARKDFLEVARCYFNNTDVESIFITSNGSLPDRIEHFVRTLGAEFPDRKIIFSFSTDDFPNRHDEIRRIDGLFANAIKSYQLILAYGGNAMANCSITVSHENCSTVLDLYEHLIEHYGVRAITANLVRDEGVYSTPPEQRKAILEGYSELTERLRRDLRSGRIEGYNPRTVQGRMMNKKNELMYQMVEKSYREPGFISYCHAGSLFGIIGADGTVSPCEVLDNTYGNLRDYNFDFQKLWFDHEAKKGRNFIRDSKCNCTYECAWTLNILGNAQYLPGMLAAAVKAK